MDYSQALHYLDERSNYERTGRIESASINNIAKLMESIGDPQKSYKTIHITGTNGKGSTAQITTQLLIAKGLRVGTYSSPHIERVNDRMCINSLPISDQEFGSQIGAIADLEEFLGIRASFFEIVTAAMFRWFADQAVDVAVVEVGMLGRWDATNVVEADVAVITNIAFDHTEYAGPTLQHIATEKAGIIKSNSVLVLGQTDDSLHEIFLQAQSHKQLVWEKQFWLTDNRPAVGGRLLAVKTEKHHYLDVFLPLHGAHQGSNASLAICAVEALFNTRIEESTMSKAMASVSIPLRFEIISRAPLIIIDGAHNPAGAQACAEVLFDDFPTHGRKILVTGSLSNRDPKKLLESLRADQFEQVITVTPPTPRGMNAADLANVATNLGYKNVVAQDSLEEAIDQARSIATGDDIILIAGSLYIASAARKYLRRP